MKKKVFIFVSGILTNPGDAHGWTDRAATWIQTNTGDFSEKFEYFSFALTRRIHQAARVRNVVQLINRYCHFTEVVLVGHSNGCDIILRALKHRALAVREVHLFAAAAEADCRKNFLNHATRENKKLEAFLYVSQGDQVLGIAARISHILFGWLGLGYGTLGCDGPNHVFHPQRTHVIRRDEMDHCDWFKPGRNFDFAMQSITRQKTAGGAIS